MTIVLHRTYSYRAAFARRQRRRARELAHRHRRDKAELATDLQEWHALGRQRRALAEAAAVRGESWATQAQAQGLPIDEVGHALNGRCAAFIAEHGIRRGVPVWTRSKPIEEPVATWRAYQRAAGMPGDEVLRAVASDSLSFPLTAALAARIAGVRAHPDGRLSLLVLGAEVGSELAGRAKWGELLGGHGLGVRELCILFCGPRVPRRLHGTTSTLRVEMGTLRFAFLRGPWHDKAVQERVPARHREPQLALAFNSGLADHAPSWLPTMRAIYHARALPLVCTSYHAPEAELDARTLAIGLRVPHNLLDCSPNAFASRLPHLDELFPGRTYVANAYLIVCQQP